MSHLEPPRRRNAGRPNLGSAVGRERIIEGTRELLRSHAPEELTLADIAAQAEVDPALVRYYFGSKKGVFRATANALLADVQARSAQVLSEQGPLRERIRRRLELLVGFHEENPRFVQLVLKEIYAAPPEEGSDGEDLTAIATRGLALTQSLLGDLRNDAGHLPDPRYLHVAVLGLTTFFVDARPLLSVLFDGEADEQQVRQGYIDSLTELLARALEG
ncbi:TetR/AcrR family transcriptional regulator [Ramlibacter sp. AW1]|uniref:TetR/AcrR family transcriptional regulator n=1 Tax=Ramlibacter aurantiacus TaxID=2801330 RepID=A0A937D4R5_9BURK|nr:TetR/AcrR family transcriptional regulator [Ramlibacter aurantiacus]MBL0422000.1 TetR/AcrR family transcriptional regulator [Ramlibacter aurantiacus]